MTDETHTAWVNAAQAIELMAEQIRSANEQIAQLKREIEELRQIVEILPGALTVQSLADVANELLRANYHFAVQRLLQMLPEGRRGEVMALMGD